MLEDEDKFDKAIHLVAALGIPLIAIVGLMMTSGDGGTATPAATPEAVEVAAPAVPADTDKAKSAAVKDAARLAQADTATAGR